MTDISKDAVEAMADELDTEVFARCGVKAKEATVLRAQSDRIAELEAQNKAIIAERAGIIATKREQIGRLEAALVKARTDALREAACWVAGVDRGMEKLVLALIPSNPTPEPTAAMFGLGGDNDDFDT